MADVGVSLLNGGHVDVVIAVTHAVMPSKTSIMIGRPTTQYYDR